MSQINSGWGLRVVQQPGFASETQTDEFGQYLLGLPIVPAPIVQVSRLMDGQEVPLEIAEAVQLFLTPHIIRLGPTDEPPVEVPLEGIAFEPPKTPVMDRDPESPTTESRWLFIFGDIGVRNPGRYILGFTLWQFADRSSPLAGIRTDPFPVVPRDRWPLREGWFTPLSARLREQYPLADIHSPNSPARRRIFPDTDTDE